MFRHLFRVLPFVLSLLFLCGRLANQAAANDLYVINDYGASISRVTPTGQVLPYLSGLASAQDLTFDPMGNLYVSLVGDHSIKKITPSGVTTTFASGFQYPNVFAWGPGGDLYMSDFYGDEVYRIAPDGAVNPYQSIYRPLGIAWEGTSSFYVGDANYNGVSFGTIYRRSAYSFSQVAQSQELFIPFHMVLDPSGNLVVATLSRNYLVKVAPNGAVSHYAENTGFTDVADVDYDAGGNLFVLDQSEGTIHRIAPDGTVTWFAHDLFLPRAMAFAPNPIPEPGSLALFILGVPSLAGAVMIRRNRNSARRSA